MFAYVFLLVCGLCVGIFLVLRGLVAYIGYRGFCALYWLYSLWYVIIVGRIDLLHSSLLFKVLLFIGSECGFM